MIVLVFIDVSDFKLTFNDVVFRTENSTLRGDFRNLANLELIGNSTIEGCYEQHFVGLLVSVMDGECSLGCIEISGPANLNGVLLLRLTGMVGNEQSQDRSAHFLRRTS